MENLVTKSDDISIISTISLTTILQLIVFVITF